MINACRRCDGLFTSKLNPTLTAMAQSFGHAAVLYGPGISVGITSTTELRSASTRRRLHGGSSKAELLRGRGRRGTCG